ncbi:winged helix-turn-helix domain-containing protein [Methanobrevibacter sp.]|uniref:winged helix-turn-helix domain-containing protein n=2 Tax=Methanobrevibacter sp. TaxID=66852 RepID=UPI0039769290
MNQVIKDLNELLIMRKGGKTTIEIIDQLLERPHNANQLSHKLGITYKTTVYHIKIMEEMDFIVRDGDHYGALYYLTEKLTNNISDYNQIKKCLK